MALTISRGDARSTFGAIRSRAKNADSQRERTRTSGVRSRVYLPACLIVVIAGALISVGFLTHWGGQNFDASVVALRAIEIGPVTAVLVGAFLVIERIWPAQERSMFARGYRQDVLFTVLNVTVTVPLVTALTLSFSELARRSLPWIVLPRIGAVPRWGAIAAIVIVMDGCNWLAHLANHRISFLWRFHELHHSQEDMSVLTVFRTHPFIHVSYLIALIPGIVLLANGTMPSLLLVLYGASVAFAHSNTRLGFGRLERVLVSPNYHRIHHRVDGPQDVNLGFVLTVWDQMFHRAIFPSAVTVKMDTGLRGRPLVVEQAGPRPRHLAVFIAQLLAPFRPMSPGTPQVMASARTLTEREDRAMAAAVCPDSQSSLEETRVA